MREGGVVFDLLIGALPESLQVSSRSRLFQRVSKLVLGLAQDWL